MSAHVELSLLAQCAEGTLPRSESERVREHLGECRSCMAAYVDAVRYRAAWLADPEAFRLEGDFRRIARDPAGDIRASAARPRAPHARWSFALLAPAAALVVWAAWLRPVEPAATLGFGLSPPVLEALARSSSYELVLPGAVRHADRPGPAFRSGSPASSLELERAVKRAIDGYEAGARGPDDSARLVAALLADGENEAARDYSRECLARHPDAVPLLVFGADARFRLNDLEGAEALLRRAAIRAPRDPLVALDLALVLRQSGSAEEARRLLAGVAEAGVAPLAARARRELARTP